jgi:prophage regulatory protein
MSWSKKATSMHTSPATQDAAPSLLRIEKVLQRTSLGRTATYELIARGQHPAPIKVGRSSVWLAREIDGWIEQLAAQRGL